VSNEVRTGLAGLDAGAAPGTTPWLAERAFRQGDVPAVRQFAQAFGARAGIGAAQLADLVLAVSEAAACATAVGPCTARLRLWVAGPRAFCEVRGDGPVRRRAASGQPPADRPGEEEALRRWVLRRLSDHVCVASGPDGVRVLLAMRVA
jgi:hypothetical protein